MGPRQMSLRPRPVKGELKARQTLSNRQAGRRYLRWLASQAVNCEALPA